MGNVFDILNYSIQLRRYNKLDSGTHYTLDQHVNGNIILKI